MKLGDGTFTILKSAQTHKLPGGKMEQIKCPKCGEIFQIDEAGYAEILKQVRNKEFEQEIRQKEIAFEKDKANAIQMELLKAQAQNDKELSRLNSQLETQAQELKSAKIQSQMEIKTALQAKDAEILELKNKLELSSDKKQLEINSIKEQYLSQLKAKDEEIAFYKDFKAKESTKRIGEDLEQFCLSEFNKVRSMGFPNCFFEKDNDARSGSKGDFIFRDSSDGVEFISIMFEMKNQMSETATKHKNEDFFKELDKDRNEKGCEYAVLVSMLEEDNDYYNTGIVDVSYKYPKMYVIRPQFFIPVITFLRNAALNSLDYKKELALIKNQNIDVTKFENDFDDFKQKFYKDVKLAVDNHTEAISQIDKAIKNLLAIKELFEKSDNHLRLANNKLEDMTIKKLTKNNPTMKAKFEEAQNQKK